MLPVALQRKSLTAMFYYTFSIHLLKKLAIKFFERAVGNMLVKYLIIVNLYELKVQF